MTDDLSDFLTRRRRAQAAVNFELATAELCALGMTIASLPGEYLVNFRLGRDETARRAETLDEALQLGRAMAAERSPSASMPARRHRQAPRMTAKAVNRRRRRAHIYKLRERAIRKRQRIVRTRAWRSA